jgi:replicative DNA helicase
MLDELRKNTVDTAGAIDLFIAQNNRVTEPLKTPLSFLRWIDEGRLIVFGGGSGLGKTAFALQTSYELAANNDNTICVYCSAEMMVEELAARLIVNQQIDDAITMDTVRKVFSNKHNADLISRQNMGELINKAKFLLGLDNFYFLNASKFTLTHIIALVKALRAKNPDKRVFVVIDYLQLLMLDGDSLNEVNRTIKLLKDTLVEERANAIVISALNRDSIRNDFVDMSAFKDSSLIEYTSDIAALFTFRNEKGKPTLKTPEGMRKAEIMGFTLHCVKNRIGAFFDIPLKFDKLRQRFEIGEPEEITQSEPPSFEGGREKILNAYDII